METAEKEPEVQAFDFRRFAESAACVENDPTAEARDAARLLRAARELRLEPMRDVLPPDDFAAICRGDKLLRTDALEAVVRWKKNRQYATRPFQYMVILGETGRGKTFAAGWLMAELGGVFVTAEQLRKLARSAYHADRQEFERLIRTKLVIVDDVGTEQDEDSARSAMFEFTNQRQGRKDAWTVLTGNISEGEFAERYDDRVVRRVQHQGAIVVVEGADLRRAPMEQTG